MLGLCQRSVRCGACVAAVRASLHTSARALSATRIPTESIRNFGIVAHIDAGKTTLTERLLHLTNALDLPGITPPHSSNVQMAPGDVDCGNTVTDFLEEERERGITIQSAAVGPVWWASPMVASFMRETSPVHAAALTLVDTPGHIDFGVEVERTVRVVDGAVVVLDGVEGVEAQSANVWAQTQRYGVQAHLFFINKLDRDGASVAHSMRTIINKGLHTRPALLQLPVHASALGEDKGAIEKDAVVGMADLLEMQVLRFHGVAGEDVERIPLEPAQHGALYDEAVKARDALLELVLSLDVALLEHLLEQDIDPSALSLDQVHAAIRRLTLAGEIAPVLCGAAARNIGIQPLLDAIVRYLPSPKDKPEVPGVLEPDTPRARPVAVGLAHPDTTALAFKVVWDKRRGPITFVRIYSGTVHGASVMYNTTTGQKERITKLMLPYADQYVQVPALHAGQIGLVLGLKDTCTGDTLVDTKSQSKTRLEHSAMRTLRLRRVHVPPPVFSVSVEPRSKAEEGAVHAALSMLVRTDPSLHVGDSSSATASGAAQTVLSGMGELHLDIAKNRLQSEFQVDAHFGHVRVGYRETLKQGSGTLQLTDVLAQELAGKRVHAGVTLAVRALTEEEAAVNTQLGGNSVHVDLGEVEDLQYAHTTLSHALFQGAAASLTRGPLSGYPLTGLHITLLNVQVQSAETSPPAAIRMLVSQMMRKILGHTSRTVSPADGHTCLMEPMMYVSIQTSNSYTGKLASDISTAQHGQILDMVHTTDATGQQDDYQIYMPPDLQGGYKKEHLVEGNATTIVALIPLARLMRYSTRLRALTGGAGTHRMAFHGFSAVSHDRELDLLQEIGRIPRL
ncbi:hypothetical protein MVES1_000035 [Malassezia vespertilionis]|uniref:uncharacterized protein n=1 Tax=Malassezia vespertilionis TaxID=2020962 RepID=UPI0024B0BC99|nr:uncharacterized protein MVES1_000035 [Malassezia vespertilionis]WFD04711.1 hypothetical protein MVES1_000035 [Malassezia vespertilionis]